MHFWLVRDIFCFQHESRSYVRLTKMELLDMYCETLIALMSDNGEFQQ